MSNTSEQTKTRIHNQNISQRASLGVPPELCELVDNPTAQALEQTLQTAIMDGTHDAQVMWSSRYVGGDAHSEEQGAAVEVWVKWNDADGVAQERKFSTAVQG
jgi:hypothetical protein